MTGYIIYYQQQEGGQRLSESAEDAATTASITGLIAGATYSITMVATSSTLPSTETAALTVTIGTFRTFALWQYHYYCVLFTVLEPATFSLSSSPSSPIVAGDSLTLTCSITLPAGVTGTPDFQWEGPGVTPTPAAHTTSGQEVSSVLTLSAIATSQAGQYSCTATLSGSSVSTDLTVTVQSKFTVINCLLRVNATIPPPQSQSPPHPSLPVLVLVLCMLELHSV